MKNAKYNATEIKQYMAEHHVSRSTAVRHLYKGKAATAPAVDVKKQAANDVEAPVAKLPAKNASLVAKGAAYHVLAGRPSKQAVVNVFGKTGYSLSWVSRAERMGISPAELCQQFKDDAAQVKKDWEALEAKSASAGAA